MRTRHLATIILCTFFILYFIIAFLLQQNFPVLVVAGENSPGTWMSGALLIICATISLIIAIRQGWWPWTLLFIFFIILALDERFMFHEQLKEHIIFTYGKSTSRFAYELPVMVGACMGGIAAFVLWGYFDKTCRVLLVSAALLGTLSLILDVLSVGIFLEESFKLVAELLVTCALVRKVE
jgi:hypothetical protein